MKTIYTLVIAVLTAVGVNAQTNLDFETWSGDPLMADDWNAGSAEDSISQTVAPLSLEGMHSMLIANTMFQDQSMSDSLGGSFAFQLMTVTPDSVKITCFPSMNGTDTAVVLVGLYDGLTYLGAIQSELHANNTSGTDAYILSFDLSSGLPAYTSIVVGLMSSKSPSDAGSFILVDDVQMWGLVGLDENTSDIEKISVYPNPATDVANFFVGNDVADEIRIIDITGKNIQTITVNSSTETIGLGNYNNGVYFYQVIKNNEVIKTSKFIVSK